MVLMKRKASALTVVVALLSLVISGMGFVKLVRANPIDFTQLPRLPNITIRSDGSIDPQNVPIQKTNNVYTLTGNIENYNLDIQCNDIVVDGAGFTIQDSPSWQGRNAQITLNSNGVTVKNVDVHPSSAGIFVNGFQNRITHNIIPKSSEITLSGYNNDVVGNFLEGVLSVSGNQNTIRGNDMDGNGIFMNDGNLNFFIGNTIRNCEEYSLDISTYGINYFYLNNFINNTKGNLSPLGTRWSKGVTTIIYPEKIVFNNDTIGNYWSDYNGTDVDHDGVGDTPYVVGGTLKDFYPLMAPVDISSIQIQLPPWTNITVPNQLPTPSFPPLPSPSSPQQSNSTEHKPVEPTEPLPTLLFVAATVTVVTVIAASMLFFFKKRKR
jgi:nitrous oxidase accessory protein NosD